MMDARSIHLVRGPMHRILPLLFVLAPLSALAQDAARVAEARQDIDRLLDGEYEAVFQRFDETMQAQLSLERLEQVMRGLTAQVGSFEEKVDASVELRNGLTVVTLTLIFERAALDARLAYDEDDRIAGLFFTPNPGARPYGLPAYADTSAFRERSVTVTAEDGPTLYGTLSLPAGEGPFPAVLLVHGSGPHDRDESIGPNKPFRDIAYGLASRGVAVLRYEKRTFARPEEFSTGTAFTVEEEVLADARAAARTLSAIPEIDEGRLFVLGHSLGGMLAPRLVQESDLLDGAILAAAPSRQVTDLVRDQADYIASLDTTGEQQDQLDAMRREADRVDALTEAEPDTIMLLGAPASYWRDLQSYDPVTTAASLDVPLLILHGGRDYQVTQPDLTGWKQALDGVDRVTIRTYPALNHLLIPGEGPSTPAEYGNQGHVAAEVMEEIAAWIGHQP